MKQSSAISVKPSYIYAILCAASLSVCVSVVAAVGVLSLADRLSDLEATVKVEQNERMATLEQLHNDAEKKVLPLLEEAVQDMRVLLERMMKLGETAPNQKEERP